MREILLLLVHYFIFLFEDFGFRIVDSGSSDSLGNAQVTLENEDIRIRFINEQGRLFLDFGVIVAKLKKEKQWYSVDIVREFVTGEKVCSSLMGEGNVSFLRENMDGILKLFSKAGLLKRLDKLHELEIRRSRDLFG